MKSNFFRRRWVIGGVIGQSRDRTFQLELHSDVQMNLDSTDETPTTPLIRKTRLMTFKRIAWPFAYIVTVALVFSWYEFVRPVFFAQQLQGSWREMKVGLAGEDFTDTHLRVDGAEKWLAYPIDKLWEVQRSRLSIRPSHDFFHVTSEHGFDSRRNSNTIEYFLYKRNDQLYILRGIARLDPIRSPTVEKLIRVDHIPDKAKEAIATYLEKLPQN